MEKRKKYVKTILGSSIIGLVIGLALEYLFTKIGIKSMDKAIGDYQNLINLFGVVISISAIVSVVMLVVQMKADYERARREKTLDLLMTWSTNLTPETNFAVKIVEKFDRDQCAKLYDMQEFYVSKEVCYEIKTVYSDHSKESEEPVCKFIKNNLTRQQNENKYCKLCKLKSKSKKVKLDKYYIKKLRYSIIQYLNLVETVLLGWQNGVIDRDVIEQQFSYLYDPTKNKNCLQDFRVAAGSESNYPSIEAFFLKLEENRKSKIKSKDYIA